MDRSIYTALNSMQILRTNQSVTSQNLANSSSTGFQKDISTNFASVYLDRSKGLDQEPYQLVGHAGQYGRATGQYLEDELDSAEIQAHLVDLVGEG